MSDQKPWERAARDIRKLEDIECAEGGCEHQESEEAFVCWHCRLERDQRVIKRACDESAAPLVSALEAIGRLENRYDLGPISRLYLAQQIALTTLFRYRDDAVEVPSI